MGWVERTRWVLVDDPRIQGLPDNGVQRSTIKQRHVVFVRTKGALHALADQCPHQGKSFEGGWCEEGMLVCPWHQMQFDPATGRNRFGMTSNVEVFPLEERANGLYIGFAHTIFRLFGFDLW
jgi:3-phenylpropionate/trans-cinnamate dioxygenase ferredoxin subunit